MDATEFGAYLKKLRKAKGLTLTQLGELIGYSNPYLSQIENGQKGIPSPEILKKLSGPLGVQHEVLMINAGHLTSTDWLINFEDSPGYNPAIDKAFDTIEAERMGKEFISFLKQPDITYNGHQVTDQDKQLITAYLDALFRDRISH
ncbi:helix-turn-helix domain-containing protein [Brevibacillus porteri]|uniref:helix-turn-helix domain-containing protein n=1 Tax=Brevibacillus porteri TaxID=2126350 RepID=UPI00362F1C2A